MPEWQKTQESVPNPLAKYTAKPIISDAEPHGSYLGRVILELWETGNGDWRSLAVSVDAVDGDGLSLLRRVTTALPAAVERRNLFPK